MQKWHLNEYLYLKTDFQKIKCLCLKIANSYDESVLMYSYKQVVKRMQDKRLIIMIQTKHYLESMMLFFYFSKSFKRKYCFLISHKQNFNELLSCLLPFHQSKIPPSFYNYIFFAIAFLSSKLRADVGRLSLAHYFTNWSLAKKNRDVFNNCNRILSRKVNYKSYRKK